MARKNNEFHAESNSSRGNDPEATVLERVQELTWALLDEGISDDEMSLLDTLLLTGEKARNQYLECVQLHTDLMAHYGGPSAAVGKQVSNSPVLSFLNVGAPMNLPSPRPAE